MSVGERGQVGEWVNGKVGGWERAGGWVRG